MTPHHRHAGLVPASGATHATGGHLTGGALWKPAADLLLRGSYAESVRAPSISELFGAQSRFDQSPAAPCSNVAGHERHHHHPLHRVRTRQPRPGLVPRFKGLATIDWAIGPVAASFTGRFIDNVDEIQTTVGIRNPNELKDRVHGDVRFVFRPSVVDSRLALTPGVNNVFDKDPPACFSCSLNDYDPTTYDVPGRFGNVRLSYGL